MTKLIQLMKELAEKEDHPSISDIADRVLKIMEQYGARAEPYSPTHSPTKEAGLK
jgi:hypothetical protein